jgi:hypothetical protein
MGRRTDIAPQRRLRVVDDPAWEAYQLRLTGMSNAEIVKKGKLGFSSAPEVARAINQRVQLEARKLNDEERDTILAIMLDQCDALIQAYWELALSGSTKDADFVLKTIAQKARLAQLDLPDARQIGQTVLVVDGDEGDYIRALRGGQPDENGAEEE